MINTVEDGLRIYMTNEFGEWVLGVNGAPLGMPSYIMSCLEGDSFPVISGDLTMSYDEIVEVVRALICG